MRLLYTRCIFWFVASENSENKQVTLKRPGTKNSSNGMPVPKRSNHSSSGGVLAMKTVLIGLMLTLLMSASATAQQGITELRGHVLDAQGAVLPGVTVVVRNQAAGMFRETVSGADGSFIASGIVPGTYEVTAELSGFKKFNRKDLVLRLARPPASTLKMEVGSIEETVNVAAESHLWTSPRRRLAATSQAKRSWSGRASTGTSLASWGCCPALSRRSAPSRSAATSSASTARIPATTTRCSMAATTTTT
jgi:hypothetical protein